MALRLLRLSSSFRAIGQIRCMSQVGDWGSGSGKGGGTGGAVRDAGGSFGKMEAAHEEQYFRRLQQEQLTKLKDSIEDEIVYHEKEIREHQEALQRHKQKIDDLKGIEDVK